MLERYPLSFYKVVRHGEALLAATNLLSYARLDRRFENRDEFQAFLNGLKVESETLGLTQTYNLASHVEARFVDKEASPIDRYTYSDAVSDLDTLLFSFEDALRQEVLVHLPSGKGQYLESSNLFGPEVGNAFPSCTEDIQNAGTCFAIGLYDACVFHLMQILQLGMNAMAHQFNVNFEYANWEQVIVDIENAVRRIDRNSGPEWREQKTRFSAAASQFSAAASQFYFLKDAIRNHFIHGREHYDEGKALSVFGHVREFMQSLAVGGLSEPSS